MSYILQRGSGKDLVFLHGYLSCKESFYPQLEYFSKFYRVTALDFPGVGENAALNAPWSVDDYADWTERTLQTLNIVRPHVIAHSFGGRVAIKCLSRGEPFDRAVLCGCAGIVPKRTLRYKLRVSAYRAVKRIAPAYAERKFGSAEYKTLSPVMKESYKKIVNEDLREAAKSISRPVLFINGENDRDTPPASAEIYAANAPLSKTLVLKNCGHFAHLDNPLAFDMAAEEFLR